MGKIMKEKMRDDNIIILNPTLEDILNDNIVRYPKPQKGFGYLVNIFMLNTIKEAIKLGLDNTAWEGSTIN